jgi:hypothetical protein
MQRWGIDARMSGSPFIAAYYQPTMLNGILQVNRSIGKVLWVLIDSNGRTITRTVPVPRLQSLIQSVDYR